MLVTRVRREPMVWSQGINEDQVSVNVIVAALFNASAYTRTHHYPFLSQHIYFQEERLEFFFKKPILEGNVSSVQSCCLCGRNYFLKIQTPCRAGILLQCSK